MYKNAFFCQKVFAVTQLLIVLVQTPQFVHLPETSFFVGVI